MKSLFFVLWHVHPAHLGPHVQYRHTMVKELSRPSLSDHGNCQEQLSGAYASSVSADASTRLTLFLQILKLILPLQLF